MLKLIAKTIFAIAIIAMKACLVSGSASAAFMEAMNVSPATNEFGGPVIEVESNGEEWTRIVKGSHKLDVKVDIQAGSGWRIWSAYIGVPNADFGGTSNQTDAIRKLGGGKDTKSITRTETHTFHTDDLVIDRIGIINLCNSGDHPATQERPEFTTVSVGIKAHFLTRREAKKPQEGGADDPGRSETAYTQAPVTVLCKAGPSKAEAPPKPVSVDIRVKQKGDTCPKDTEVSAFIDYEVPMTARFHVIHNGSKSEELEIKAREVSLFGKTWYRIERMQRYKLDPGSHTFQIKVVGGGKSPKKTIKVECPPFKVTSAWLSYKVEDKATCKKRVDEEAVVYANRPGDIPYKIETQGGLVVTEGIAYAIREGDKYIARRKRTLTMGAFDQNMRLIILNDPTVGDQKPLKIECLEFKGDFSFIDKGAPKCERTGQALINFSMNVESDIGYSLDCNIGHFSGVAKPVPNGKGGYVAPALVKFDIEKTTRVACALKSVSPGPTKIQALKGELFQCITPTFDPVTTDLTSEPNPTHDQPTPTVVVDPPKTPPSSGPTVIVDPVRIVCLRGAVRNFQCYCPAKHKKTQFGPNRWRCDRYVVDPPRTPPGTGPNVIVDPVRIVCLRGAVRNNGCYCAPKHKKKSIGKNKWRCDPPSTGPNVIVDPPRRISCRNGAVRKNNCFCPRNRQKVRVGSSAWNCVLKATVVPPKKPGSSVNSGRPKIKTAPLIRTQPKKKKKNKSSRRRSSSNSGATQMRMIRRR